MNSDPNLQNPQTVTHTGQILVVLFVLACGLIVGLGSYTFKYAQGLSYFSKDPRACANCHIMRPQYDSWQKASHHASAACVDCHLPSSFIPKYLAKASNGWHHSKGFTLQNFQEPIRIKPGNSAILQANCVRCHTDTVHAITSLSGSPTARQKERNELNCVHCHANVGHGERTGLGGPLRPHEIPDSDRNSVSSKPGEKP
jgi:cytochrome c nitrite reductase small subunit